MSVDPAIAFGASHQGARDYQEDRYDSLALAPDGPILLIVCDGMGGHSNGAEAAQSAMDAFVRAMHKAVGHSVRQRLKRSLDLANEAVAARARAHPDKRGMGCTLAAALVDESRVHWASVGDSPIWLVRGSKVERLNEDHSMGGLYKSRIEKGEMTEEEARQRGGFNQLRSAVMGTPIEIEDFSDGDGLELQEGDTILVASDGILTLPELEIADQLRDGDARKAALGLVDQVIAAGRPRQDNVTAVIYRHRQAQRPGAEAQAPVIASHGKRWVTVLGLLALLLVVLLVGALVLSAFRPELLQRR